MTSKRSLPTSSPIRSALLVLLIAIGCVASADYVELAAKARTTNDPKALARLVRKSSFVSDDAPVQDAVKRLENARPGAEAVGAASQLRGVIDLYAINESTPAASDAAGMARTIRASGIYRDPGLTESSNWLGKALERLKNLFRRPRRQAPNLNVGFLGPIVTYVMWGILIMGVAVFLFLALRHLNWRANLRRKAAAIMEEDEPERTADEWLAEADRLEASGDFRRAVRCLYLACLLRFDESKIARFDRGQTNWEHLARIQASPLLPEELDFQPPTKAFDRIWYGNMVRGHEDVELFREYYNDVKTLVSAVPA